MEEINKTADQTNVAHEHNSESGERQTTPRLSDTNHSQKGNILRYLFAFGAGLFLVLAAWYWYAHSTDSGANQSANSETFSPQQVVARVNGVDLYGENLSLQMVQIAQASGLPSIAAADDQTKNAIRTQSLDALINTELISQVAHTASVSVTQEEVDAEFDALVQSIGGNEVANQRLEALGLTAGKFKENLANDILIRKYLEATHDESELAVSEVEIENFYANAVGGQTENVPTLDEVRFQIEEQLKFQKQQQALLSLIEELRAEAQIEILI